MAKRRVESQILTIQSWELSQFPCVQVACHISLEIFWWKLQLCFRPHLNRRSTHKVMGVQSHGNPNFGNFGCYAQIMLRIWNFGHKKQKERGASGGTCNKKKTLCAWSYGHKKHKERGKVQHVTKKKSCTLRDLDTKNTKEGWGATRSEWKKNYVLEALNTKTHDPPPMPNTYTNKEH